MNMAKMVNAQLVPDTIKPVAVGLSNPANENIVAE
jgi:hypothetical protein